MLCGESLEELGYSVAGVCSPDDPLRKWAESRKLRHFGDLKRFSAYSEWLPHDYLFSIVNFALLPNEMLRRPRRFAVNYHDGPLPRYAGLCATSWAILNREKSHGITWHVMVEKVDAGDILEQVTFEIDDGETAYSLNHRCYLAAAISFRDLAGSLFHGSFQRVPQDLSLRTYYGRSKWPPVPAENWTPEQQDAYQRAIHFGPTQHPRRAGIEG